MGWDGRFHKAGALKEKVEVMLDEQRARSHSRSSSTSTVEGVKVIGFRPPKEHNTSSPFSQNMNSQSSSKSTGRSGNGALESSRRGELAATVGQSDSQSPLLRPVPRRPNSNSSNGSSDSSVRTYEAQSIEGLARQATSVLGSFPS